MSMLEIQLILGTNVTMSWFLNLITKVQSFIKIFFSYLSALYEQFISGTWLQNDLLSDPIMQLLFLDRDLCLQADSL